MEIGNWKKTYNQMFTLRNQSTTKPKAIQTTRRNAIKANKITKLKPIKNHKLNQCQIEGLIQQMHCVASEMNIQITKNRVLQELVRELEWTWQENERTQKKLQNKPFAGTKSQIELELISIDRVLKKQNEVKAKINQLKQNVNSIRSQRVIFSNMFKKLETQIKKFEQIYKNELLFVESMRKQQQISISNKIQFQPKSKFIKQAHVEEELVTPTGQTSRISEYFTSGVASIFDLSKTQSHQKCKNAKFFSLTKERMTARKTPFKDEQKLIYCQNVLRQIEKHQHDIQKIKILGQTSTTQKTITKYAHIIQENQEIIQKITKVDEKCADVWRQIKNLKNQIKDTLSIQLRFENDGLCNGQSGKILGFQIGSFKLLQHSFERDNILESFYAISKVFGIDLTTEKEPQISLDALAKLDSMIDIIYEKQQQQKQQDKEQEQEKEEEQKITNKNCIFQDHVGLLLDKMLKFSESQRVLDINALRAEYQKEITIRRHFPTQKNLQK